MFSATVQVLGCSTDLQDDIVKDLKVLLLNLHDVEVTPEGWSAYAMTKILEVYGVPDTVQLHLGLPYDSLSFSVELRYDSINTSVLYYVLTTESQKYLTPSIASYCPEEIGVDSVVMHIGKHPFNKGPDGVPLSKATGLDEQAFHKLFTENPSACLTLNRDAMP